MPRRHVALIDRPIGVFSYRIAIASDRSPEVCHVAISVVDRFDMASAARPQEHHSAAAEKRFHVILDIAQRIPHHIGYGAFASEPRKGRFVVYVPSHGISVSQVAFMALGGG